MKTQVLKLIALTALLVSLAAQGKVIEQTFSVAQGGTLNLKTDSGSIRIDTHDEDTVIMEVTIEGRKADQFSLNYSESGADVEITGELERKGGWSWNNNLKVKFELIVPKSYNLDMHTSGGSISIADLIGNVDAHTSGGSIRIGNITGDVEVDTSGGSIKSKDITGHVNASTSGGSIDVTITEQLSEDAKLTTSGGSITARLNPDIKIDLNASTSGGRVNSDFNVNGKIKKTAIRGEINGGGPKLTLRTSGGSVNIETL